MKYEKYSYYYPPRPELKTSRNFLKTFDNGTFLAQPKLNGSCCELFISPDQIIQKGRHNNTLTNFRLTNTEIRNVFGNIGWNVVVGEYMNKSKNDENGDVFNHKFVIFDQIVFQNDYVLDSTFDERVKILKEIYKPIDETEFLYKISENIWMVKTFYNDFEKVWDELVKIDMYEGLVMKRKSGKLEIGNREKNNTKTQLKCRKSCKNYPY
jgi:hypothetical protein